MRKLTKLGYTTGWGSIINRAEAALKQSRPAAPGFTTVIDGVTVTLHVTIYDHSKDIFWTAAVEGGEVCGRVWHYDQLKQQVREYVANHRAYQAACAQAEQEKAAARQARIAKHDAKMKRRAAVAKARHALENAIRAGRAS